MESRHVALAEPGAPGRLFLRNPQIAAAQPRPLPAAGWRRPLYSGVCVFPVGLWGLAVHQAWFVERHDAGEIARAQALLRERHFGRSQTAKSDRLRQPAFLLLSGHLDII